MRISKKYSFSLISFALLFSSIPFVLKIDEVAKLPFQYQLIACLVLPLMILIVSVSYLTGQAKIDLSANYGSAKAQQEFSSIDMSRPESPFNKVNNVKRG